MRQMQILNRYRRWCALAGQPVDAALVLKKCKMIGARWVAREVYGQ